MRLLKKQVSKKKTIEQNQNFVTVRAHITAFSQGIQQLDDSNIRKTLKNSDLSMSYLFKVLDFFVNRANIL